MAILGCKSQRACWLVRCKEHTVFCSLGSSKLSPRVCWQAWMSWQVWGRFQTPRLQQKFPCVQLSIWACGQHLTEYIVFIECILLLLGKNSLIQVQQCVYAKVASSWCFSFACGWKFSFVFDPVNLTIMRHWAILHMWLWITKPIQSDSSLKNENSIIIHSP